MKKKICISILLLFIYFNAASQDLKWTGTENNDFFNESNWQNISNGLPPDANTLNPNEEINYNLYLTCNTVALGDVVLSNEKHLFLENGELITNSITGSGIVNFNENAHIIFEESLEFSETTFHFNVTNSSLGLKNNTTSNSLQNIGSLYIEGNPALLNDNIKIDNYFNGALIRPLDTSFSTMQLFSEENLSGVSTNISQYEIYSGDNIPENFNNLTNSFVLERGYMATLATNENGTGKSKVFIASQTKIIINQLPNYLKNNISFVRVIPWNWVNKKGTAGDITYMNNDWFYRWSNNGESDLNREYVPMVWGKGAANDQEDIDILTSKIKSTHVLAFNEPDNCNDQSGQYGNMCIVDTAFTYYKNLAKTGMRLVSPACRQDQAFTWLNEFNQIAQEQDVRIDVIAVHWYDWNSNPQQNPNANPYDVFIRFANYLEGIYNLYGLPIWITEFNANRYRNEWVHRQFLELALPYLENLDYVERYSFFPPVTDVADFFDENNNLTWIGEFYHNFQSSPSLPNESYQMTNNISNIELENNYEYNCNPELSFLSIENINNNSSIYPNPSDNYIHINSDKIVSKIVLMDSNGRKIKSFEVSKKIDVSFLENGIYFLNVDGTTLKFIKK